MKNEQFVCCPHCTYDANSSEASHCQICGTSLDSTSIAIAKCDRQPQQLSELNSRLEISSSRSQNFFSGWLLLPSALFFLAIAGGIFIYADKLSFPLLSRQEQINNSRIKLYRSVRDVENTPKGLFSYGHSFATAPLHTPAKKQIISLAHPEFDLQYAEPPLYAKPGSSTSVKMLLDGSIAFAELSRPLEDEEYAQATKRGWQLQQIPFAIDGLTFFVNPQLPVDRLSVEQIRAMLLGKIVNWKQVGGPNLPVVPFVLNPKTAPGALSLLLNKSEMNDLGANVKFIRDHTSGIRQVASTPGAISYASAAIVVNQNSIRTLLLARPNSQNYVSPFADGWINATAFRDRTYPLVRRFFIAIRRDGSLDEQAGLAYANMLLSDEGQKKLVEKAGFVPIR
ncbi:MAG: substrate-binding domain-containing protein [Xenococcaceae cyanobacterium]